MMASAYATAVASAAGIGADRLGRPGTTVVVLAGRPGVILHRRMSSHSVVFAAPELVELMGELDGSKPLTTLQFSQSIAEIGARVTSSGVEYVLADDARRSKPDGVSVLDPRAASTTAAARRLQAACSSDELGQAQFDPDDLDPHLVGVIAATGELRALGGAVPMAHFPSFADLGVLVHPDHRRAGVGAQVVAATVELVERAGLWPRYQHRVDNAGSAALAVRCGFVAVATLDSARMASAE